MSPSIEFLKTKFAALLQAIATGLAGKLDNDAAAVSADKLTNPFQLSATGDVLGAVNIQGNSNVAWGLSLSDTGVAAGSYPKVTVNAKGRVVGGSLLIAGDIPNLDASKVNSGVFAAARIPTLNQNTTGNAATATKLATSRTISLTGDGTWSVPFDGGLNASAVFTLANSGVTAGTYGKVTVDAKGRVTAGAALVAADIPTLNQDTTGNAGTANRAGVLNWTNYGGGQGVGNGSHVIFDASNGVSPSGKAVNNTNPEVNWASTYPTLMGWNGTNTYGVRVDRARYAESLSSNITINGVAANVGSNITIADSTKLPLAGGSLSGALKVVVNTAGTNYGNGQLELRNSDAGYVSMGFHRGGYTACQLRHAGNGLILSGTDQTTAADLYVYGNVTAYSDERLKTDIETIPEALAKVEQMNGVTFAKTNEEEARRHTGVIAQEVLAVLPEAVHMGDDGFYSVAYGNMVGLLIEAVKELSAKVKVLEAKLEGQ